MLKKLCLFFLISIFYFYSPANAAVTGWYCGTCSISNLAMSDGSTYCQNNPCDESCYFCGSGTTNMSLLITGGTRNWQEVCPAETLIYCNNGIPSACDLGGGMV